MQVFLYWPKQYTFLCGYYGDQAYWCGDAGMFVPKDGSDRQYHSEACHVRLVSRATTETRSWGSR